MASSFEGDGEGRGGAMAKGAVTPCDAPDLVGPTDDPCEIGLEEGARQAGPGRLARLRRHTRRAVTRSGVVLLEVTLGLLATFALGVGLCAWRLSQGPIELNSVARHLEAELSAARDGRPISIGRVELAWNDRTRGLELTAFDVRPRDANGQVLSTSRSVALEVSPTSLILGRLALSRAAFSGGELAIVLAEDGSARVSLGPPGSSPDLILPAPPPDETLVQRANRILDGFAAAFRPLGAGAHLNGLSVDDLQVVILQESSGRRWTADGASFALSRNGPTLSFKAKGVLTSARGSAPVSASIATDVTFQRAVVEARVENGRLDALAPEMLGALRGLEAPVTAAVSATLDRKVGVELLEGEAEVGRGRLVLADGAAPLDGGRLRGRYDIETDVFVLEEAGLAGSRTRILGEGRIENASALMAANPSAPAEFSLGFRTLTLDMPGVFAAPTTVSDVSLRGEFDAAKRTLSLAQARFQVGESVAALSGQLWWAPDAAQRLRLGARLDGGIEGAVAPDAVLALWPVKAAPNARAWVAGAVKSGRVFDIRFKMNAPPGVLGARPLKNDAIDLAFAFDRASVDYIKGMPPIMGGAGRAQLNGDSFSLALERGETGGLTLADGRVLIEAFEPPKAKAIYAGRATGDARAMVELLRRAPIGLDQKFPFEPASIVGRGEARFEITRPMGAAVPADAVRFKVSADLEGVGARPKTGAYALSDWALNVAGDDRALTFSGPLRVNGSPIRLAWTETLKGGGATPSRYTVDGAIDAATIEALGAPITPFVRGPVGVRMSALGAGEKLASATVEADLTGAEAQAIDGYWHKPKGTPATVRFDLAATPDGGKRITNLVARGQGLRAEGEARFLASGDLAEVRLPRVDVDGRVDGRIIAQRTAAGALNIEIAGREVGLGPFLERAALGLAPFPKPKGPPLPITGVIRSDRLTFRGGAALKAGAVDFATDGTEMSWLTLQGATPNGPAKIEISPRETGPATITVSAPDAGLAWEALTGQTNVSGGTVKGEGVWTPYQPVQARMTVTMRDFQLMQMPAMTQLLSSVGSLRGMVDMLNGDGIAFNQLVAPIALSKDRLKFTQTRMNGPSLGMTADGAVDLATGRLTLDGVVVPSYGLNSFLGGVPILGNLLTSRRGEGVVGLTFSMRGPADDARVFVNPLSALAPGILRRIFEPLPAPTPAQPAPPGQGG